MPTKIEWTDETWNPVTGCTKVSPGCKFCYAERVFHRVYPGRTFTDVRMHSDRIDQPLRWKRPRKIFVNSMSDLFHESVPEDFIGHVFATMARAKQHTFQILTKRPRKMLELVGNAEARWGPFQDAALVGDGDCWPLPNVWLGVSVENQETADERIWKLLETPAATRFVSYEPALASVHLTPFLAQCMREWMPDDTFFHGEGLNWVIAGGESGPHARPSHPDWFRSARDQCQAAGVPFFFKRWGEWAPQENAEVRSQKSERRLVEDGGACGYYCDSYVGHVDHREAAMVRVGRSRAGRLLDGREWSEFPKPTW